MEHRWRIGDRRKNRGLHAFVKGPGGFSEKAACAVDVRDDGDALAVPKHGSLPHCRRCEGRLKKLAAAEEARINGTPREKFWLAYWAKVNATHWWVERHGGHRRDKWVRAYHSAQGQANHEFKAVAGLLRRGGVRLVDPDGRVERIHIRSGWMKQEDHDGTGKAVPSGSDGQGPGDRPAGGEGDRGAA